MAKTDSLGLMIGVISKGKKVYSTGKKIAKVLGYASLIFSAATLFVGREYYKSVNNSQQFLRDYAISYIDTQVSKKTMGKNDAEQLKEKVNKGYGIDYNEIINGILKRDFDKIRKTWENRNNTDHLKRVFQKDANQIEENTNRQKSTIDDYLNNLGENWDIEVVGRYHQALGELKSRGLDTGDYETKYDKIRTRNEEEDQFYRISDDLIHQINVWCANGCDGKRVAVDAGLYFAKETRGFKPKEINLNEKARELSQYLSEGLTENSEYPVRIDLTKYLSTSK